LTELLNIGMYVVSCHQQTTARLIYKMRPLSNLPSDKLTDICCCLIVEFQ